MIAKNNEYLSEASKTLYEMNADNAIREQCLYRQEREKREYLLQMRMQELTAENDRLTKESKQSSAEIVRLRALLAEHNIDIENVVSYKQE